MTSSLILKSHRLLSIGSLSLSYSCIVFNPRNSCAAGDTVLGLCVSVCVCRVHVSYLHIGGPWKRIVLNSVAKADTARSPGHKCGNLP